jgi:hypothetical protein
MGRAMFQLQCLVTTLWEVHCKRRAKDEGAQQMMRSAEAGKPEPIGSRSAHISQHQIFRAVGPSLVKWAMFKTMLYCTSTIYIVLINRNNRC